MISILIFITAINILIIPYLFIDYIEFFTIKWLIPFINFINKSRNIKKIINVNVLPDDINNTSNNKLNFKNYLDYRYNESNFEDKKYNNAIDDDNYDINDDVDDDNYDTNDDVDDDNYDTNDDVDDDNYDTNDDNYDTNDDNYNSKKDTIILSKNELIYPNETSSETILVENIE